MREVLIRLLAIQTLAGLAIAAGFYVRVGGAGAIAAVYGVAIGLLVSLLLAWRMGQAARPGAELWGLLVGAIERMLFVCVAFGTGIALLHLAPLALVIGFAGAQAAYYIAAGPLKRHMLDTMGRQYHGE
jgi:F0F1-type ATP synthase assembly protein I